MKRPPLFVIGISVTFLGVCCSVKAQVSFFQPPTYSGNGALFVADFNSDGKPDILTGDGTMNLGNGDGTFTLGAAVSGGVLAVADFNGDGKPDVLQEGTGILFVLLGNGDGTFQTPISSPSNANLSLVAATDLNADGKADAIGIFNNALIVYLGKGDGTFAAGVSYNLGGTPGSPVALSFGDFNGDGNADVVVTTIENTFAGVESAFLGNGDGTFQSAKTSASMQNPGYVIVGDFNGDGKLDLAASSSSNIPFGCGPGGCVVSVLLGNGDGTFQIPASVIAGSGTLASADLNGDGILDLVFQGDPTLAQIFLGNGDGTFSNSSNYVVALPCAVDGYCYPTESLITIGDFNRDGKTDLAISGQILLGNGNGALQGIPLSATALAVSIGVTGIFDKSSRLTGVAAEGGNTLYILKSNGDGTLSVSHTYTLQMQGYQIFAADLNGDGNLDLLVLNSDVTTKQAGYSTLLGNGDGSFQAPNFYALNLTGIAALADLNHDSKVDLVIEPNNQTVAILLGLGDGTFSSPISYFNGGYGVPVIADFNGDGNLDISSAAETNTNSQQTAILYGNGDGTFPSAVYPPSLLGFAPSFADDLNHDGNVDLIGTQVALGHVDGTFMLLPLPFSSDVSFGIGEIADFNGDARLDLIATTALGHGRETQVLLGNGDGTFGPPINVPLGYLPTFIVADVNNDGRPDLIFFWSTSAVSGIGVELNTTQPSFELSAGNLSPASVAAGNSATATLRVTPTFGFSGSVTLSCSGLPSGATCSFNPSTIVNSSGSSVLTVSTTASTVPGTYSVKVQGSASSIANSVAVSLVVQAPPDFGLSPASGSPTSQTTSAGQTASFSLDVTPSGAFTGAVSLNCAITPVVNPAATCSLSSATVNLTSSGAQSVTVSVKTTGSSSATLLLPDFRLPWTMTPWILSIGMGGLMMLNRRRRTFAVRACAAPILILALGALMSCGGNSTSTTTTHGTPPGTYTATVTATSGSLSHNTTLQVIVH